MSRHVLAIDLKDDAGAIAEYRAHHRRVWPEVVQSLRRAGIKDMSIHILGRRLIMIVDTQDNLDYMRIFAAHVASDPRVIEWETLMKRFQQPAPGAAPGEWWTAMEPLFDLSTHDQSAEAPAKDRVRRA